MASPLCLPPWTQANCCGCPAVLSCHTRELWKDLPRITLRAGWAAESMPGGTLDPLCQHWSSLSLDALEIQEGETQGFSSPLALEQEGISATEAVTSRVIFYQLPASTRPHTAHLGLQACCGGLDVNQLPLCRSGNLPQGAAQHLWPELTKGMRPCLLL